MTKYQELSDPFPLDDSPPEIVFSSSKFCFTGIFAFGPRIACQDATRERGGIIQDDVASTTDYLVIGTLSNPDWKHRSYGRKIEAALYMQNVDKKFDRPARIAIIHEDHWAKCAFMGEEIQEPEEIKDIFNPLPEYIESLLPYLEKKGWHVSCNDFYLGVTGYMIKKSDKGKASMPRQDHIVSLCRFEQVDANGTPINNMWEVKTYWTVKRQLFEDFGAAYDLFRKEEIKYHPEKIKWSMLHSEEIKS